MLSRVELVTAGDQCNLHSLSQADSVVIAARAKMFFFFYGSVMPAAGS